MLMRRERLVMLLRVAHGVAVTHGIIKSGRYLISLLRDLPRVLADCPSFLTLYVSLTATNLFSRGARGGGSERALCLDRLFLMGFGWHFLFGTGGS